MFRFFVNSIDRNPTHQPAPRKKINLPPNVSADWLSVSVSGESADNLKGRWQPNVPTLASNPTREFSKVSRVQEFFPPVSRLINHFFPHLDRTFHSTTGPGIFGFLLGGVCKAGLGQQHSNVHQIGGKSSVQVVRNLYFS